MTFDRFSRVKKILGGLSELMTWRMGKPFVLLATLTDLITLISSEVVQAEEPVPAVLRGAVDGSGTYFEVMDSDFLNVILDSSEVVTAHVLSYPDLIRIRIKTDPEVGATQFTLSCPGPRNNLLSV
jgi:hypothetical protein